MVDVKPGRGLVWKPGRGSAWRWPGMVPGAFPVAIGGVSGDSGRMKIRESQQAADAYREYLGMGPERSVRAVARRLGKSSTLIGRWSSRWSWPERVAAEGDRLALVERLAVEDLARRKAAEWLARQTEQREEEWRVRGELLEVGREALRRWKAQAARCGSLEGVARVLEVASKLGRLASGMATDRTELTGEDGGAIRVELGAALTKIYGEDRGGGGGPPSVGRAGGDALPGLRASGRLVGGEPRAVSGGRHGETTTP